MAVKPNAWSKPLQTTAPPPGLTKPQTTPNSSSNNSSNLSNNDNPALRERFLHLLLTLVGQTVQISLKNGAVYAGVFHTATPFCELPAEERHKYVLKAVSVVVPAPSSSSAVVVVQPGQTLVVDMAQVVQVHVKSLRLDALHNSNNSNKEAVATSFQTDTEISGSQTTAGHSLVAAGSAWTSPTTTAASSSSHNNGNKTTTTTTGLQGNIGGWDQFKANEELFNVTAGFDENVYTTALDKSSLPSHQIRQAEQMAREIETAVTSNMHVAEERNQALQGDYDEEDRYSGVLKKNTSSSAGGGAAGSAKKLEPLAKQQQSKVPPQSKHQSQPKQQSQPKRPQQQLKPPQQQPKPSQQPQPPKQLQQQQPKQPQIQPQPQQPKKKTMNYAAAAAKSSSSSNQAPPGLPASGPPDKRAQPPTKESESAAKEKEPVNPNETSAKALPAETKVAAVPVTPDAQEPAAVKSVEKDDEKQEKNKPEPAAAKSKLNANAKAFTLNINAKTFTPGGGGGGGFAPPEQQQPLPPQQQQQQPPPYAVDPNTGMPIAAPHMQGGPHYMPAGPMGQPGTFVCVFLFAIAKQEISLTQIGFAHV